MTNHPRPVTLDVLSIRRSRRFWPMLSVTVLAATAILVITIVRSNLPRFNRIDQITISPDGKLLAADCSTAGIWVWDLSRPTMSVRHLSVLNRRYRTHNWDKAIEFADATTLFLIAQDARESLLPPEVIYWDVTTDQCVRSARLPYWPRYFAIAPADNVAVIAPKGRESAVEPGEEWKIIDLISGDERGAIPVGLGVDRGMVNEIQLSRNGRRLVAAVSRAGEWGSEVWDLETKQRIYETHRHSVESISDDGETVALDSVYDMDPEFWTLDGPKMLFRERVRFRSGIASCFLMEGHSS